MTTTSNYDLVVHAPGRINLIGEHTDYNDGFVLPAAIHKRLTLRFTKHDQPGRCKIQSKGFSTALVLDLNQMNSGTESWHNYIIGVIREIQKTGKQIGGFDCELETDIPVGSGVSSSAALECGLGYGLNELFDLGLSHWELARIGQSAEHNYVGTKCGIMDQFASLMGKKNQAMFLDCRSLEFEYVPCQLDPYIILMLNTNVSHNLATSGYNDRREESASALALVADRFGVEQSYRNLTPEMVQACQTELGETRYKRGLYVVEEILRVQEAVKALKEKNLKRFGELLYASHKGQSTQYEVSCPELDFLVEHARKEKTILGARMTGGGFGGCTLNLIEKQAVDSFVQQISTSYRAQFGIDLTAFQALPSEGVSHLNLFA